MKFTRNPSRNGSTNSSGTLTPESEVVWWERLTRCYLAYTEPKDLSFKQKQAAFKVLFNLGMATTCVTSAPGSPACPSGHAKKSWV